MGSFRGIAASAVLAFCAVSVARAQDQAIGDVAPPPPERVGYKIVGPSSPSSGTSTVTPSSVPQAMERLADSDSVVELSLGSSYAEGRFGTGSKTTISSSALAARARLGRWTLSASLPWMKIDSASTIFASIDSSPVLIEPNTSLFRRTSSGFGDATFGASYLIEPIASPVEIEISGRAKINTANSKSRLSSGENDYALGVDVSYPLGPVTPFGSVVYRFLGDPVGYNLRSGPAASAGASYSLGPETFVLTSYHYSRAATWLVDDAHELFAGASTRVATLPVRITAFGTVGMSTGAPAASAGLAIAIIPRVRNVR